MSADKPKGPAKPFLGDDELSSELDAWDEMFDNLHAGPEAGGPVEEPMAWPEPEPQASAAAQDAPVPERASGELDPSRTLDDFPPVFEPRLDSDLEEQLTLDHAVETTSARAATAQSRFETWTESPDETDFSDVGATGEPAALGDLLGPAGEAPPFDESGAGETRLDVSVRPPFEDDEEVYTSASRPNVPPASAAPLPEDPVAPPPKPAPVRRTGPAIIRRTPLSVPIGSPHARVTPRGGYSAQHVRPEHDFSENTRVADVDVMEAAVEESRRADARSKAPTAPPPLSFAPAAYDEAAASPDDDEYEIEIASGDDIEIATAVPEPVGVPRRTVAHVLRRDPTKQTPLAPLPRASEPVIEPDRGSGELPRLPAAEDDFSDVAAAVGAEEVPIDELPMPSRRSTPAGISTPTPVGGVPLLDSVPQSIDEPDLEDAAIDDHVPTRLLPDISDPSASGDAYVPMAPLDDDLDVPLAEPPAPEVPVPQVAVDDFEAGLPARLARGDGGRPPSLMDLYPRVKRPTSVPVARPRPAQDDALAGFGEELPEIEPIIDLEAIGPDSRWPEQVQPLPSAQLDEEAAHVLLVIERELPAVDDPDEAAALRVEAGRLCERLGDLDRARTHYDAALLADPRATAALRGLRRIARAHGDLVEVTRQLDAEIAVAGALERRPLGHYRVDLLMASGEYDLARVAVGELLDTAPSDVRALLAQLELAFLDGRAEEFGSALEQLAHAVTDNQLRAAVQQARGMLAAHHGDAEAAARWFTASADSDPGSLAGRLGVIRETAARDERPREAQELLQLAELLAATDPTTAAALALRAQHLATGEVAVAAASLASRALPADPLVARVAAETTLGSGDTIAAAAALSAWADSAAPAAERTYAAARAAELDPPHGAELWAKALQLEPGDDYAAAQLRTAHVAAEQTQLAIEVDLATAGDSDRERARLRAAFGQIALGELDSAIALLQRGHEDRPGALAITEALAEAYAAAGRWIDRARLLGELAATPGDQLDPEVAQLRSALAWEEAVGAALSTEVPDPDEVQRATAAALEAWEKVAEQARGTAPGAHAAAIVLATRLGDRDVLGEVLARAQAAERSTWGAVSLALRRARLIVADDPAGADALVAEVAPELDDPRRTVVQLLAAARRGDVAAAATLLEDRADKLGDTPEAAALGLRAAQLALDAGDALRATALFRQAEQGMPGVPIVSDLLAVARRRAGDASGPVRVPSPGSGPASPDEFARVVRDADEAAERGEGATALSLYQAALEMRPGDPLAMLPLIRVATELREPGPIAAVALAQLRAAEAAGDGAAKAAAYELLSHIDKELRNDVGSAQIALESASQADPSRIDLMHRLEREYTATDQIGELLRLRRAELAQIPAELARDRAAMIMDTAVLADRDGRTDDELVELYREVVAANPAHRLGLLHLESLVRRTGASEELAKLEEQIAAYFDGDPRTQAAFFTRAGETFTELGQIDAAVQRFGKAEEVMAGYVPALEAWRNAALKGQLWIDVAEAATRQASVGGDPELRASLHHFAGVALMDKALIGEQAMAAFRRALEADPTHRDAFLRLRILLEEDANHDELAIVIANRLEHEPEGPHKIELHRALAELSRNFLNDRDTAKQHYREVLEGDPNDLRAHAAIADIAWEQGAWQEAADALIAYARLERDPDNLKRLCFRLGLIYADRLVDVPMALKAFQRALTYDPDDELVLVRLADLATQAGEWKLALGACERLVKTTEDSDKRAEHLHRVARIFRQGFGDMKRAERALNLALDNAPTNDDALTELVKFYREAGDMTSVRVHLNRVAGTMRVRAGNDPKDGVAYRVISRAMSARAAVGVGGSLSIARAAAELAQLLGAAGDPERVLLAEPARIDLAPLLRRDADDVLFPRGVQPELRQIFTLLGDRIAKHVGVDLRAYGVARGDRLRARDSSVAAHAQDVATGLGFGDIDVYVSARQPFAMVAEPTSPVSLVLGQKIAEGDARSIRFAAGTALKLAQAHLAIPARLSPDDLGVLVVALLRQFQDQFPTSGLDEAAIATQMQKLRRLIPTGLSNEIRPYAYAIDASSFSHHALARDIRVAGLRAGLIAAGSLLAGLGVLAGQAGTDVPSFLSDPLAQGLVMFALGEDHATLTR